MSYFRINLKELNEAIEIYKNNYSFLREEYDSLHSSLNEVDAGWMDKNSLEYREILKKDRYNTRIYFNEIARIYRTIETFKERLNRVSQKYSNGQNIKNIMYNEEKIDICIEKLTNVNENITNSINYISQCNFSDNYNAFTIARQIISNLVRIRNYVNQSIRTFNMLKKEISSIITNFQMSLETQKDINLDIKKVEYKWQVFNPETFDLKNIE